MTFQTRTEREQVAFFEEVHERFRQAAANVGEVRQDYRVAGVILRLSFAGQRLVPPLTAAIEHLRIDPGETPDATFCLWDSLSTRVSMVPRPCDRESISDRGDLWGFNSNRVRTAFHYHDYSVNIFDHERRTGIFWVQDAGPLPYWTVSSPLRTLFHWWMEHHDCQLVHAAAVGVGEHALLLVGRGGVGKSSTALACLRAGFEFLGDDYVIVRHDPTPTVYGLYATAKINPDDIDRFPELKPYLFKSEVPPDEKAVLRLYPRFRTQLRAEMPLAAVALPQLVDRDDTRLIPEGPTMIHQAATFTTMSQLPYAGDRTHRLLKALCEGLPAYRIELGRDRVRIPEAVRAFLSDAARPPDGHGMSRPPPLPPLVSVIIPVYNGERFVTDAVGSVLSQNYPSLEIIIVDDGSTDGTEVAVGSLPVEVRYFKQENLGPAAARNRGIRDASGDFVAFLDVDDLWPEGSLARLMDELQRRPELEVVRGYSQVMVYDPVLGSYEYRGNPAEAFPYSIPGGLYRKRVFDRVGLFDRTLLYGEDSDWFNRAQELNVPMERVEAITLHVRRHGMNMTHGKTPLELNMLRVFKKRLDRRRAGLPPA